ncbi:hypothetical protein NHF50_14955 [Flavobacterium sp. NRK F10]|uniref:hypothetical protein n=1 Tax=Flavobacterium sp. NRK F10 TaxID=2954931 RepID=UPI002091724F|nr:hypothetical protein [Flavobacterium sp. NRK F10]MCO6176348.1 hypothetical protein [Flavobacterium sp. NRK F10]
MDNDGTKNAIGFKEDRLQILKDKKQLLTDLGNEINVSKWKRSFSAFYYNIRYFTLIALAGLLLVVSLIAFVSPTTLFFNSEGYKKIVVSDFRTYYKNENRKTLDESLVLLQNKDKSMTLSKVQQNIDRAIERTAIENGKFNIRLIAAFLIILVIILWVTAGFSKKMKMRNELALKTNTVIQEIISDYSAIIEEEEREIKEMKQNLN